MGGGGGGQKREEMTPAAKVHRLDSDLNGVHSTTADVCTNCVSFAPSGRIKKDAMQSLKPSQWPPVGSRPSVWTSFLPSSLWSGRSRRPPPVSSAPRSTPSPGLQVTSPPGRRSWLDASWRPSGAPALPMTDPGTLGGGKITETLY